MEAPIPSRILITGISGFLGSYLVEQCRARYPSAELFGLCRRSASLATSATMHDVTLIEADITQTEQMRLAVTQSQPDIIFHLAAQSSVATSWNDPVSALRINAGGAIALLEAIRIERQVPRILLVGSGEQYGSVHPEENPIGEESAFHPINPYGVSKSAQDLIGYQYHVAYVLPVLRVRLFNTFGPRQSETFVVANFAHQIAKIEQGLMEPILMVGNLQARRDFLPVEDAVNAMLAVAQRGEPGQAYNIGSGIARSIEEILHRLLKLTTRHIEVRNDPARLRPTEIPLLAADITHIRAHTAWEPTKALDYALEQTLNYWRAIVAQIHRVT